ncbi:class I adenylate-forming enzyme family protein [Nonomuraea typhae]|uniref:class I adenylate-forming enzyme family protein n=1 Tax=Nonomuraea typhae TaxID=2603600 RepID=UPI0012FAF6B8|nr:AMP-binding protein [Nonomuraea typhae]
MSIPELLRQAARRHDDRPFLIFPDRTLGFAEVDERTDRLAGALAAQGVRPGDRVAVMFGNVPDWPLSWLAVLKTGAITVPVNAGYGPADLAHVLGDSGARLAMAAPEHAPAIRALGVPVLEETTGKAPDVRINPWDLATFSYTSGTTGFPKACMLPHSYWTGTARLMTDLVGFRDDDVVMVAQPFSYMDPQWMALMCLVAGVPLVVLPRFSASGFWPAARRYGATVTYVLGTMPMLLYKQPPHEHDRDNRMRLVMCSGIPPKLHAALEERWSAPWRELYGSTESGPDLLVHPDDAATVGTGAMGFAPPGKEVKVLAEDGEPGEIVVRGRPMMRGYWNHPDATAHAFRGGWYHTGDLGYQDEHGYIHHAGRLKDMVRRGGENISCAEVENVLSQHPAVQAAALVPIPDELWGELPKAFIQLHPGHAPDGTTAARVIDHARERLARFKIPAFVEFVDAFVYTPSQRIEKRHLLTPGRDQRAGAIATEKERA